jgi:sugar phosphate isomerase/epimerase
MHNRRKFLKQSTALAMGTLVFQSQLKAAGFASPARALGIQLFTFFSTIDQDVPGTLKKIADLGYREIESAFSRKGGYYGMRAKEFASALKDLGLSWKSHHITGAPFKLPPGAKPPVDAEGKPISIPPMRNLRDHFQEVIDELAEAGVPYLVCASTPITSGDEVRSSLEVMVKAGEAARKSGIQLAFHNHDAEFRKVDDIVPYEYFLAQSGADILKMELDLAWSIKGGADPVELFNRQPGRFPLWHVKDVDKDFKVQPVGKGTIDFKRIFANADKAGLKHFFVEHDMPQDATASITASRDYLKGIL